MDDWMLGILGYPDTWILGYMDTWILGWSVEISK